MIALFERFEIKMTFSQAKGGSHSGRCDDDIQALLDCPKIKRQLKKIPPVDIAAELKGYGAWDEKELQDHEQNIQRIIWIAASNISEEHYDKNKCSKR